MESRNALGQAADEVSDHSAPTHESAGSSQGSHGQASTATPCGEVGAQLDSEGRGEFPRPGENEGLIEEVLEEQLMLLRAQHSKWKPYNRNSATWAFFAVNDGKPVDQAKPQVMRCVICHNATVGPAILALRTRCRKGLITYFKANGITAMKKHVEVEHSTASTRYVEEINSQIRGPLDRQPAKKRPGVLPSSIVEFFGSVEPFRKDNELQKAFLEDLVLWVVKSYLPLRVVEGIWLQRMALRLCPRVVFPSRKVFTDEVLGSLVEKTLEVYVLPALSSCISASASFDLWMSKGAYDVFGLVVNFLTSDWEPKHITIGLFEATETVGHAMAVKLEGLLDKFSLKHKIIAYVKDEGSNLNTMTQALKSVVSCDSLNLPEPFQGSCFGHAMSKACQYATNDEKVSRGNAYVSIKTAQAEIQKCITWPKKSGKGRQEWEKACVDAGMRPRKLNTPVKTRFASRVLMFEDAIRFRPAINLCYSRQSVSLQARVPSWQTWAVANALVNTLSPVVSSCVLNQSRGHWLLSDALHAAISMTLQFQSEVADRVVPDSLVDLESAEFDAELLDLTVRMKEEVVSVLSPFLAFMHRYDKVRAHNMLALMLDPRFKGLRLVSTFLGRELAVQIAAEYDTKSLLPLLLECYQHLLPSNPGTAHGDVLEVCSQYIFQASETPVETTKELVKRELSLFRRFQVDAEQSKCPLQWWKLHEPKFPTVALLARQVLGIPGSQIETERIFSIAGVLTALRRCRLQTKNLDKMIFVLKNWPDDPREGCHSQMELGKYHELEADLDEELDAEFDDEVEREEFPE